MTKRAEKNGARVVADALRADEPVLDGLTRARLEKRLVEAALAGAGARSGDGGARGRLAVGAGVLALAAAAALFVVVRGGWLGVGSGAELAETTAGATLAEPGAGPGSATFEAMGGDQPVRRGAFGEGEAIETQAQQRVLVRFAESRVEVTPQTRARFARLRANDVRIALDAGRVDVAFHPRRRGAEHLTIETPSARVEVVGTEFTVELDAAGATTVRVSEGVVRVVPLDGSAPRLVRAGTRTRVIASRAAAPTGAAWAAGDALVVPDVEPTVELAGEPAATSAPASALVAVVEAPVNAGADTPRSAAPGANIETPRSAAPPTTAHPEAPVEAPSAASRLAAASRLYHHGQLEEAAEALLPIAHDARAPATVRRDASNLLGDIYKGWRRLDDAATEYDRACTLGSDESCYSLGGVAETLEENDRARVAYRTYLRRAPDGALAMQARARLCRPLGVSEACYGSVVTPFTP